MLLLCFCLRVDSITYLTLRVARAVVRFILCFYVSKSRQHDLVNTLCSTCSGQVLSVCFLFCLFFCLRAESMAYLTLCVASAVVKLILWLICLKVVSMSYLTLCIALAVVRLILWFLCLKVDSMTYLTLCVERAVVKFVLWFVCRRIRRQHGLFNTVFCTCSGQVLYVVGVSESGQQHSSSAGVGSS